MQTLNINYYIAKTLDMSHVTKIRFSRLITLKSLLFFLVLVKNNFAAVEPGLWLQQRCSSASSPELL